MNIVSTILNLLSGSDAIGKIAPLLGISHDQAGKAVNAAVPSVLAGFLGAASRGGGGDIANAVSRQNRGLLDNLPNLLSSGSETLTSQGSSSLSSILGGAGLSQITSVLSRFTGLGEGVIGKLLGMITPVILGVIGRNAGGLDSGSITRFLTGQKDNIQSALPSGLSTMLASAIPGLSSALGTSAGATTASTTGSATRVSGERQDRSSEPVHAHTHNGGSDWWKWAIPLVLAGLVLYFLPKMFRPHERPPMVGETTRQLPQGLTEDRVAEEGSKLLNHANDQIASINDEASASAALPQLRDTTDRLASYRKFLAQLPGSTQKGVINTLRPLEEKLRATAKPVLALPEVGPKVKSTFDGLFSEVDKLDETSNAAPVNP